MHLILLYLTVNLLQLDAASLEQSPAMQKIRESGANPIIHQVNAGQPDGSGWFKTDSTGGSFQATFPFSPVDISLEFDSFESGPYAIHMVTIKTSEEIEFVVKEMPFNNPEKKCDVQSLLDKQKLSIENPKYQLKFGTYENQMDATFLQENSIFYARMRSMCTENSMILAAVQGAPKFSDFIDRMAPKFLQSVQPKVENLTQNPPRTNQKNPK